VGNKWTDPILARAAKLAAQTPHAKRERVCAGCVTPDDFVFGKLQSDRRCARCKRPIGAGAVVGPDAWSGGAPIG
jgi:hypothetical protein